MPSASSGRAVSSPRNDCPGDTVSMFVPSRSRTASSDARLASEIARTATIAAMPMAMPTAVSDDRSLRDAEAAAGDPGDLERARTMGSADGRQRRPAGVGGTAEGQRRRGHAATSPARRSATIQPVLQLHAPRQRRREVAVVGDHRDRRAVRPVQVPEQLDQRRPGDAVEVSGGLVGEHDRRPPDDRPRDRHSLPLAAGQLARPVPGTVRQPDAIERHLRSPPPVARRQPAVQEPVGDVVDRRLPVEQVEVLEHEPDPPRTEGREPAVGQAVDALAGHRHLAAPTPGRASR